MTTERLAAPYPAVRKRIEVACSPQRAFDLFTASIGEWWPLVSHSVFGSAAASVVMGRAIGDEIVEISTSGERTVWGRITAWERGRRLAFTWHPGVPLDETTDVEIQFAASPRGAIVELEHRGWERRRDPAARRADYDAGWVAVLESLARRVAEPEGEGGGP